MLLVCGELSEERRLEYVALECEMSVVEWTKRLNSCLLLFVEIIDPHNGARRYSSVIHSLGRHCWGCGEMLYWIGE